MITGTERAQAVEQLSVLADRVARERRMCSECESWDHCDRDGCALLHKVALSIAEKPPTWDEDDAVKAHRKGDSEKCV